MNKIGIIVAMREEQKAIIDVMEDIKKIQIFNLVFFEGKIQNKECIIVKSGIGKVNAARTTQILTDNFELEYIINIGAGGAVNPLLDVGDVLVAKYVVQHDFDITAFGHSKGFITGVGDKVYCDYKLLEKFQMYMKNAQKRDYNIKIGVVATGDIFCTDPAMRDNIIATFDADVVDMECGAIGQVCYLNQIPFVEIRTISDSPNGKNASTFDENLEFVSKRCSNILEEFLK